jgi:ankyrin repeat protein
MCADACSTGSPASSMNQHHAARKRDWGRVQQLVTKENVNKRDGEGPTVLSIACTEGDAGVVAWLLGMGADVNVRDNLGWTPLHIAALYWRPRCVQLLLGVGADTSVADNEGYIPLHFASNSAECTALLIAAHPAGVHVVGNIGYTPLHRAVECGVVDVCSLLLDAGSVVDAVNKDGYTPLHWALFNNTKRDVAELLLDRGAQLERVKLDNGLKAIPEWAVSFVARRNACRSSCVAVLELARRRSRVIGGNTKAELLLYCRATRRFRNIFSFT